MLALLYLAVLGGTFVSRRGHTGMFCVGVFVASINLSKISDVCMFQSLKKKKSMHLALQVKNTF